VASKIRTALKGGEAFFVLNVVFKFGGVEDAASQHVPT
jgi:hypothetical protein